MVQTAATFLDWLGIVVFAVTGALVASRKEMDVVGFAVLGTVTGIGGGTVRDLLLGVPVFWTLDPAYLVACVAVSAAIFFVAHVPSSRYRVLLWLDALGLSLFAVVGVEKAVASGAGGVVAVAMGVVTATAGGMIRDVLGGESPVILSREIYATAALLGAVAFLVAGEAGASRDVAVATGFAGRLPGPGGRPRARVVAAALPAAAGAGHRVGLEPFAAGGIGSRLWSGRIFFT